jgi:DNA-binding CsgD family transcriptional regulator
VPTEGAPSPSARRETRAFERENERLALERSLADARASRGGLTLIEGPAGIGKTRLLELAREQAELEGMVVLAGRGGELERDYAFGVVRQVYEHVAVADPGRRRALTAGAAGLAAPVLDLAAGASEESEPTYGALHGLYWLTVNISDEAPLLVAIDDVQWVDVPSLRFLVYLTRRLEGLSIALICSRRTGDASADIGLVEQLALELRTDPIRPAPLSADAVAELLSAALDVQPSDDVVSACAEVTGGNPFLLRELITELRSGGRPVHEATPSQIRSLGPERVATALLLRVGRLHRSAPALAQAIAVLGDSAPSAAVAELAGLDAADASDLVGRLREISVLAADGYRFVHPIVRASVYEDLSPARRSELHARAAVILREAGAPGDTVAAHVLASEPRSISGSAAALRSAAAAAAQRGAPESAAVYLERALEEEIDDHERADVLAALGDAEHDLSLGSARERYRAAIELTDDPVERARLTNALAWASGPLPDVHRRQLPLYERALGDAGDDAELAAMLEAACLFVAQVSPERARTTEVGREGLGELRGKNAGERLLLSFAARRALMSGRATADEVATLAERAAQKPVMIRRNPQPVWLLNVADCLNATERWEAGERLVDGMIVEAERGGSVFGFAIASYFRAVFRHSRGDLRRAEEDATAALEASDELLEGWRLRPIIDVFADTGRAAEGEGLLERHGYAGEIPPSRPLTPLLIARGRMRVNGGDVARGRTDLDDALGRMQAGGSRGPVGLDARIALAIALQGAGEHDAARALADDALASARRWGTTRLLGGALRARGVVAGDSEERLDLLRESAHVFEGSPVLLWRAETLIDLGAALHVAGERAEARTFLARGLDLADRSGADPLAERAEAELARAGARPRRRALTGIAALTASERRVARMAADGLSNKAIAQALFVTLRTVEMHLSRSYAKLEITSRRELPRVLAGDGR